jgi:protein tyrosine/serine phosphatase
MRSPAEVLYNFHWIVPLEAARSSQAYAGFLGPFLRVHGIRAMINFRGPNPTWRWWRYEKRVCARLGIEHHDVMLSSKNLLTRGMLVTMLNAFDHAARPFLMKCSGGQDRTSFAAALYLLHVRGWDAFAEAIRQLSSWPYLHWPRQNQRWLKLFLFFARDDAGSKSISFKIRTVLRRRTPKSPGEMKQPFRLTMNSSRNLPIGPSG